MKKPNTNVLTKQPLIKRVKGIRLGIAINDIGKTLDENGKTEKAYSLWLALTERVYSAKFQERCPQYKGVKLCKSWNIYSNFKRWFDENYIEGYDLDKDLLSGEVKIYSPETCAYIPRELNLFLAKGKNELTGAFPSGKRWYSKLLNPITGKTDRLGVFDTPEEAHKAWKKAKHQIALKLADMYENQVDPRVTAKLRTVFA